MALMMDALLTPEETPIISKYVPESPRNPDRRILGHGYHVVTGRLEYHVRWANQSLDTLESYPDLHHLEFLYEYETRMGTIDPGWGDQLQQKSLREKIRHSTNKYILQRDQKVAALEGDKDSEEAELGEELQLSLEGSPWFMGTPAAPSIVSPLATSGNWLQQLASGGNSEEGLY
jgi:hypothetical protein